MDEIKIGKEALGEKFQTLNEGQIYTKTELNDLGIPDNEIEEGMCNGDIFEISINKFKLLL